MKKINFKKTIIPIAISLAAVLIIGIYLSSNQERGQTRGPCLSDDEVVDYSLDERYDQDIKIPKIPLVISIKDRVSGEEKFKFEISDVAPSLPIEIHRCGVYGIREFNFDYKKFKPLVAFMDELWKFDYSGVGIPVERLFKKEGDPDNFARDFKVDPTETFLVLERSYLGNQSYAIVIKNLDTKENVFVLTLEELVKEYPVRPASIGLGKWRDNGKYFWAVLFEGSRVNAYIRITANTWEVDVLSTPEDYTGGLLSSPMGEYIAYTNGPGFIGVDVVAQQIYEEWRKEGKKKNLYLYNLFTKEKFLLFSVDDPSWNFKSKWLSDTELEYELPTGEKKVYKIDEK